MAADAAGDPFYFCGETTVWVRPTAAPPAPTGSPRSAAAPASGLAAPSLDGDASEGAAAGADVAAKRASSPVASSSARNVVARAGKAGDAGGAAAPSRAARRLEHEPTTTGT